MSDSKWKQRKTRAGSHKTSQETAKKSTRGRGSSGSVESKTDVNCNRVDRNDKKETVGVKQSVIVGREAGEECVIFVQHDARKY